MSDAAPSGHKNPGKVPREIVPLDSQEEVPVAAHSEENAWEAYWRKDGVEDTGPGGHKTSTFNQVSTFFNNALPDSQEERPVAPSREKSA